MAEILGTLYSIAWGNPHTDPPDGAPRVLAEYFIPGRVAEPPGAIRAFPHTLGGGYGLCVTLFSRVSRRQSPQTHASIRQKRLRRRLEQQVPLFAEQLYAQGIARKEAYYLRGITDANLEAARKQEEAAYAERLTFLRARANQLIVYASEPVACAERGRRLRTEVETVRADASARKANHTGQARKEGSP